MKRKEEKKVTTMMTQKIVVTKVVRKEKVGLRLKITQKKPVVATQMQKSLLKKVEKIQKGVVTRLRRIKL